MNGLLELEYKDELSPKREVLHPTARVWGFPEVSGCGTGWLLRVLRSLP